MPPDLAAGEDLAPALPDGSQPVPDAGGPTDVQPADLQPPTDSGDPRDAGRPRDQGPGPDTATPTDGGGSADVDGPAADAQDARPPADGPPDLQPDLGPGDPPPPLWFLHISDTHVGEKPEMGELVIRFLEQVPPVVQPLATLHTGDLVDLGGEARQWEEYRAVIAARTLPYPQYLEIPGNHDVKEGGTPGYQASARSFLAGAGMYGETWLDTPQGRVRIVRAHTADTSLNPANVLGYFGEEQQAALLALPVPDPPPRLTLLLAHHPMNGLDRLMLLGSDQRMQQLIDRVKPQAYLCGHRHVPYLSWLGQVLSVQAGSLGKGGIGSPSFMLLAYDQGTISADSVPLQRDEEPVVSWPLLLITRPADPLLGTTNPLAEPLRAGEQRELRALAFAPAGVDAVDYRWDGGDWVALAPGTAPLWSAPLPVPAAGVHTLEVRAVAAEGQGTQTRFGDANRIKKWMEQMPLQISRRS